MSGRNAAESRAQSAPADLERILAEHHRYVQGRGGARASFKAMSLAGADLSGRVLDEADFTGACLAGANLKGASLTRASLYCADLRAASLHGAKLEQADIRGASFRGADLSMAVLDRADLRSATMMVIDTEGVSVVNHARKQNNFGGVDFSNCSLKSASFGNAKLDGAVFHGALLIGTSFRGARLTNASFTGAVLMGVDMQDLNLPPETFAGCTFGVSPEAKAKAPQLAEAVVLHHRWVLSGGAEGRAACLDGEDLRPLANLMKGRNLVGLQARGVIAIGLDFSDCLLQGAKFEGADLRAANFSSADLSGVSFHIARLAHAGFKGARFSNLRLRNGEVLSPNLLGADADPAQFEDAVLEETLTALGLASGTDEYEV